MEKILHTADSRGHNNFGWLDSHHSFSFGRFYNPERVSFGKLRVLNDDFVSGGAGFGTHPHDNMEIVSIPLQGAIEHQDSTGTRGVIHTGDVQIMSAGSGITHSEYNHSASDALNFLQLWVIPDQMNIKPRYDQKTFNIDGAPNQWHTVVAPDQEDALWINQDSYFSLMKTDKNTSVSYQLRSAKSGVYIFVIDGGFRTDELTLGHRDATGIYGSDKVIALEVEADSYLLAVEVPM